MPKPSAQQRLLTGNQGLNKLLAEAKKIEAKSTTGASKKSRTSKTKIRIMHNKHDKVTNHVITGSLERHHIHAQITTQVCPCGDRTEVVDIIQVYSKSVHNSLSSVRMTHDIRSYGMLEFNSELPVHLTTRTESIPACPTCIKSLATKNG